ncbi:MAG: efflux RND transporter periplasmic adaptor subunit [Clostridia bacterium]|nr:efflux RND transporter periplasmic adaptor subunit [Clostridia bacterium]
MRFNRNKFKKTGIAFTSGILIATLFAGCGSKKPVEQKAEVKNVKTITANIASISTEVEYASKLKPLQEISISPKVAGKVATVKADVGSIVEKGQVLMTLDSTDLQAQLQQQQANLDSSRTGSDQALQNAQIAYNNDKETYEKNKQLFESGAISQKALDDAKQKLDNSTIALNFARDKYNKEHGSGLSAAAAGVQVASAQIQNTIVTSPISGVVSLCNVDVGEIASSAAPAFTVIDDKTMVAELSVPDRMIGKIKKGQKVSLKVNALNDKMLEGTIDSISPAADSKMQTYAVKVKVDNPNSELKSGMFARVILPEEKKENVVVVPNEAVKVENSVPYIYTVINKDTIKKVAVTTGLSNDKVTEIASSLKEGDAIITEGQIFLNDGEKVNVVQ